MQSPFPGMDPFIEARGEWDDFQRKLVGAIGSAIESLLPEGYVCRIANRVYFESLPEFEGQPRLQDTEATELKYVEWYLDIKRVQDSQRPLVTTIEVLSQHNKWPSRVGWNEYQHKRNYLFCGAANLVEMDLIRGGVRPPMKENWPDSPYYILVFRKEQSPLASVYPAYSTGRLPVVPIPLSPGDSDMVLELQPLVDDVFQKSRYHRDMHYEKKIPNLRPDEQELLQKYLEQM